MNFSDAALVWSATVPRKRGFQRATYQHADELRRRKSSARSSMFLETGAGIAGVMRGVFAPRVFIVRSYQRGLFHGRVIPANSAMPK